jgi:electron transfer flavoprotein beta subunit
VRIVVLLKPVPDPGEERLGDDGRLDRSVSAVINGNDEYVLEAALKLVEAHGGDVTLLSMAPDNLTDPIRKALAMGATRALLVSDPALAGSCAWSTTQVLAAALRTLEFDLVLAGDDTSDGGAGVVAAGVAALLGLPYLSRAQRIEPVDGGIRVERLSPTGHDVLEAVLPALVVGTQLLGEPRYPTLRGIMGARSKEIAIRTLAEIGLGDGAVGGARATTALLEALPPSPRGAGRIVREPDPTVAAAAIVGFLVERRAI